MRLNDLIKACPNIQIIGVGFPEPPKERRMTLEAEEPAPIEPKKPRPPKPAQQSFLLWEPDSLFGMSNQ